MMNVAMADAATGALEQAKSAAATGTSAVVNFANRTWEILCTGTQAIWSFLSKTAASIMEFVGPMLSKLGQFAVDKYEVARDFVVANQRASIVGAGIAFVTVISLFYGFNVWRTSSATPTTEAQEAETANAADAPAPAVNANEPAASTTS